MLLPAWQTNTYPELRDVLPDLNDSLRLAAEGCFQDQIATTSVGDLSQLVVIAANPGWDARRNPREHEQRLVSPANNLRFVNQFFSAYPSMTQGTTGWWTKVLRLQGRIADDEEGNRLKGSKLWAHAHQQGWKLGGLDLIPFHSRRDHITPLLSRPNGLAAEKLRRIATETLRMTLRIGPRVMLVASKVGAELIRSLAKDIPELKSKPAERRLAENTSLWRDIELYRPQKEGTTIISFPGQVFSGSYHIPDGHSTNDLAELLRDFLTPRTSL